MCVRLKLIDNILLVELYILSAISLIFAIFKGV